MEARSSSGVCDISPDSYTVRRRSSNGPGRYRGVFCHNSRPDMGNYHSPHHQGLQKGVKMGKIIAPNGAFIKNGTTLKKSSRFLFSSNI